MIRRSEHWSAFPLWLTKALATVIGGGRAVDLIVQRLLHRVDAFRRRDLRRRRRSGPARGHRLREGPLRPAQRVRPRRDAPETRLHHLLDASDLDGQTLARLGELDGATILDRDGNLLAYGAIITSSDSQHEGPRTAAAKTLSAGAAVLKVSEDGDITVFREGQPMVTLLPSGNVR